MMEIANRRLCASTMTMRCFPRARALEKLAEAGFQTVELCTVGEWVPHYDLTDGHELAETCAELRRLGLRVVNINVSGFENVDADNFDGAPAVNGLRRALELAQAAGCDRLTMACGNIKPGQNRARRLEAIAAFNSKMADLAEKDGLIFSVEAPHKLSIAESEAEIDAYWAMQDERVHCTLDPAHMVYAGVDPVKAAKKLAHRVSHAHLRDAVKGNSLLRYGEGIVPIQAFADALNDGGYTGYFSMEYPADTPEEADERLASSVAYLNGINLDGKEADA